MVHKRPEVKGRLIDYETRCEHYHSKLDVVAVKFKCCETYYPCIYCHNETAGHNAERWPRSTFNRKAVLCGVCGKEHSILLYLRQPEACPTCSAPFNPGCSLHYHYYFDVPVNRQFKRR